MASLRFLLGMIPPTSRYESEMDTLRSDFTEYKRFEGSDELKHFLELEKEVNSAEFKQKVKSVKAQNFKQTDEFNKEKEYKQLLKSSLVKKYLKAKGTEEEQELAASPEVKRLGELETFISSEKFAETKKYMALSPQQKYELTEEFKREKDYLDLVKSEKIIWYKKILKKYPFSWVEKWEGSFEEKFDSPKPDSKTWMNRYFHGDKMLNKPYVMADDRHAFTDGKNLEILDKKLRIVTRKEKSKCLVWDPSLGFYEKEFEYTSDLISSAKSFTQTYGLIEAKIRFASSGVTQSFSLMSEQILPHVDIVKFEKGKIRSGNFWKEGSGTAKSVTSSGGGKYSSDFHIFSLVWEPGKLTWKVNGVDFKVQTAGIPEQPLYMVFNSSLKEKASENGIPAAFEIDWIRVYKSK